MNQRDDKGFTALHRAAYLAQYDGYLEIYEYLLVRGGVGQAGGRGPGRAPREERPGAVWPRRSRPRPARPVHPLTPTPLPHLSSTAKPPSLPPSLTPSRQSRGADPSLRTEDYDPYLNPGRKLPVEVALDDEALRAKLLALERKYADVPKVGVVGLHSV